MGKVLGPLAHFPQGRTLVGALQGSKPVSGVLLHGWPESQDMQKRGCGLAQGRAAGIAEG